MDLFTSFFKKLGYMWYIMNPKEHMFENVNDVPDYYKEVTPVLMFLIVLEQALNLTRGKKLLRLNDSVANIFTAIIQELFKIPLRGVELLLYTWIYNNWRMYSLPWDSVWTWILCMITTDFGFYWMHRATHSISLLWLFHESHHSSEEFNLTTPLRLSVFTSATFWLTYLPMAFLIPPATFFVHYQMTIIYQICLHSECVPHLGPFEYIFVTPSHHRVHHGRNRRCIDKNFSSFLIIWDRLFGTFEPEGDEKIVFGLTKPLQSFNPIAIQTNHLQNLMKRLVTTDGFWNRLSIFFKGPGWSPGKPWLGNLEDIPEPKDENKYDPRIPKWLEIYILLHTSVLVIGYLQMALYLPETAIWIISLKSFYMILTTIAMGCLLDLSSWGPVLELLRCPLYFILDVIIAKEFSNTNAYLYGSMYAVKSLFFLSSIFWIFATPLVLNFNWLRK